ncbi:MAG: isocitrate/isopropylmalate dehydrogenase family protein [Candidatus Omnitrophica bacterium]|nr:isocitrate/isopropylmalate dehydrogenase family protein [Candidatus Omnitrophota bacterium]
MAHKVSLLPGDGIGPEVTNAMKLCVEATGVKIDWEVCEVGEKSIAKHGTPLTEGVLESIRRNKTAIKGPITTPIGKGFRSVNVQLRQALDLYACVRPCFYYEGTKTPIKNVNLVIFRENTEDLYAGIEFDKGTTECERLRQMINEMSVKKIREGSAISIKPISGEASKRIVRAAFEYAVKNGRKKITAVHKANIMKFSDGLFLKSAQEVAKEYEGRVEFNDCIVDNMCMQLVQSTSLYDMLVLPNLYGDIVSDLCAGLIGGLGIASGANYGDEIALFEPVHGSAPKYVGQNKVNPTATILSSVLMLKHLKEDSAALRLENAVRAVLKEGKDVTYDLKASRNDPSAVGTLQMAEAICKKI